MADNLQINIGGNAEGAKQAADEMGRSFAQNAEEMQKHLTYLNQALDDFKQHSGKKITPFSLKDLGNSSQLQNYAIAIKTCYDNIIDYQIALEELGPKTERNKASHAKLVKELEIETRKYEKLQASVAKYSREADAATKASDKLAKSTEKSGNFLRQMGVTTMLYGVSRITNELYRAAEAAQKFQEVAEGLENIKAPSGIEFLAENRETLAIVRDIVQGGTMGAAAGSMTGNPLAAGSIAAITALLNTITGYQERKVEAATDATRTHKSRMESIKDNKIVEAFNAEKNAAEEYLYSKLSQASTPMERESIIDEAINMFDKFSPDDLEKRIDNLKRQIKIIDEYRENKVWDMNDPQDQKDSNALEESRRIFEKELNIKAKLLDDYYKFVETAEKTADAQNKADAKAEEELAKQKAKAEKEAAAKALKDKKDALNAEYKALQDKRTKEQQLIRDTEKETSDIISQREEKIAGMTSTRDSISTNFSKVGGSVGPQFAALSKSLLTQQEALHRYQNTVTKNLEQMNKNVTDIKEEIKANREKLAVLR